MAHRVVVDRIHQQLPYGSLRSALRVVNASTGASAGKETVRGNQHMLICALIAVGKGALTSGGLTPSIDVVFVVLFSKSAFLGSSKRNLMLRSVDALVSKIILMPEGPLTE